MTCKTFVNTKQSIGKIGKVCKRKKLWNYAFCMHMIFVFLFPKINMKLSLQLNVISHKEDWFKHFCVYLAVGFKQCGQ